MVIEGDIEEANVDIAHMAEAEAGEMASTYSCCLDKKLNVRTGVEDEGTEGE